MEHDTTDAGVSAVVGVILMVAVTVVLAATTFGLTMGFFGLTEDPISAGVSVEEKQDSMIVQAVDLGEADKLIIQSPRKTENITTTGQSVRVARTGCMVNVLGVRDGKQQVVHSFFAGVGTSSDLVSFWAFEACQVDGDKIVDASGKKAGTIEGDPQLLVDGGVSGDAFDFDGDGDEIVIGSRDTTRNITVSVWVKPQSGGWMGGEGAKWRIASDSSNDDFVWWVRNRSQDTWSSKSIRGGPGTQIDQEWWHVVGVFDNSNREMRLYVNGKLVANATKSDGISADGHDNMVIGNSYDGASSHGNNTIDEFRVYKTALTKSEIQSLCETDAPANHTCAG